MGLLTDAWNWAASPVSLEALQTPSLFNPAIFSLESAAAQGYTATGLGTPTGISPPPPQINITGGLFGLAIIGGIAFLLLRKK